MYFWTKCITAGLRYEIARQFAKMLCIKRSHRTNGRAIEMSDETDFAEVRFGQFVNILLQALESDSFRTYDHNYHPYSFLW